MTKNEVLAAEIAEVLSSGGAPAGFSSLRSYLLGRGPQIVAALRTALPTVPAAAPVAQSGWVSCADRLPDNLEDCLVLIKPINEALMHTNGATPYYKITHLNFAKTGFYVEYTEDGQHPLEEATHWQPLPTPPTPC